MPHGVNMYPEKCTRYYYYYYIMIVIIIHKQPKIYGKSSESIKFEVEIEIIIIHHVIR